MITVYGISNCDTVKKARRWLDEHQVEYRFHNYKTHGIDTSRLLQWNAQTGWVALLNKRGTTWRKLSDHDKKNIDENTAIPLLAAYPSMIKRPVLEQSNRIIIIGFNADKYQKILQPIL